MAEKISRAVLAHAVRLHEAAEAACKANGVQAEKYRFAGSGSWWDLGDLSLKLVGTETTPLDYMPRIGRIALRAISDQPNLHRRLFDARRTSITDPFFDGYALTVSNGVKGSRPHPGMIPSEMPFEMTIQGAGGKFLVPYSDQWVRISDEFLNLSMDTFCMPTERTVEALARDQRVLRSSLTTLSEQFGRKPFDGSAYSFKVDDRYFARITSYTPELYRRGTGSGNLKTPAVNQDSIFLDLIYHSSDESHPDQVVAFMESYQATDKYPDLIWTRASRLLYKDKNHDSSRYRTMTVDETIAMVSVFSDLCLDAEASLSIGADSYASIFDEAILGFPSPEQAGVSNLVQPAIELSNLNLLMGIS